MCFISPKNVERKLENKEKKNLPTYTLLQKALHLL